MLKPTLLAGLLLASYNVLPLGVPVAHAAPTAAPKTAALPAVLKPAKPAAAAKAADPLPSSIPATATVAVSGAALTPAESRFITLINNERTTRGENALVADPLLVAAARAHSREMCTLNYFDHHSPTPGMETPMARYLKGLHDTCAAVPPYLLVGENIYYCSVFNDHYNVDYGHASLMHSPGHRANILEPRFTKIGVGIYQDAAGHFWVTQMFMKDQP